MRRRRRRKSTETGRRGQDKRNWKERRRQMQSEGRVGKQGLVDVSSGEASGLARVARHVPTTSCARCGRHGRGRARV